MTQSLTERLVRFCAACRFEDLPATTAVATQDLIRDTLACIVAGRDADSSRIIADVLEAQGGAAEATVLVSGAKLPAPRAAHVNAHCGNALDADDTVLYKAHIGSAVVPAALALAEQHDLSGADLIAAVAVGYEAAGRIGLSLEALTVGADGRFRFGPVTGYSWIGIGAAIAAGKLLRLDPERLQHAVGIAAATLPLPGATRFGSQIPRPMTKYAMYGAIAEAGVLAALYAEAGFTGERDVLDGEKGLWRVVGSLATRGEALVEGLGEHWIVERACYKIYPACRFISGSLDNFYRLVEAHSLDPREIDEIVARVPEAGLRKLAVADPRADTLIDAGFSLPFMLGAAAFGGVPGPRWLDSDLRTNREIETLKAKVRVEIESSAAAVIAEDLKTRGYAARMPCTLEIRARGRSYAIGSEFARGDDEPGFGLTAQEHERKFRAFCAGRISAAQIDAALEAAKSLARQPTLSPLIASLVRAR